MEKIVLVVQGDGKRRGALRDALSACGLEVLESSSPAEAMGMVRDRPVDGLVVSDEQRRLAMRGLCGLVKKGRQDAPVFVLLNETSDEYRVTDAAGGDAVLLPKDSSPEQVATKVTASFGGTGPRVWSYEKVRPLRRSKLWESHVARNPRAKNEVTVAQLTEHFAKDQDLRQEFMDSVAPIGTLSHRNIPRVREIAGADDIPFIAQDYMQGSSLFDLYRVWRERGRWPSKRTGAWIAGEIASALECAHAAQIVHGALTPESVWVTNDGRVQLLYLGVAGYCTSLERSMHSTAQGLANLYIAPEQSKDGIADIRTDVFLVGVILNEILLRKPLASIEASQRPTSDKHAPADHHDEPSDPLRELALNCLERNPGFRPQTASSLKTKIIAALEAYETTADLVEQGGGENRGLLKRLFHSGPSAPANTDEVPEPQAELAALMRHPTP
jgi:serine/threonine protein kinase